MRFYNYLIISILYCLVILCMVEIIKPIQFFINERLQNLFFSFFLTKVSDSCNVIEAHKVSM